jgi:Domain of Unknown Function with PDB structure (DUF3857)/Transglutaminase-like superfamily
MTSPKVAILSLMVFALSAADTARADAPAWMHNLVNAPLPAHDERTDAVVLYSEEIVTVLSPDKIRNTVRVAYKILRPSGREHGTVMAGFNPQRKITSIHGWCIPAQGKDYEVKDKDSMEISIPKISGSELISDVKDKMLQIPAADPGNIVGYEYETEESPLVLQTVWQFQEIDPVKNATFTLQLPPGWEYKAVWRNYTESKPTSAGSNQWRWSVSDVKGLRPEEKMPPWPGVAGLLIVNFFPASAASGDRSFQDWQQMGNWYLGLTRGRRDATPEIKQKVQALTASAHSPQEKMQAIAQFLQRDVRYVAISLGIGGIQPHSAADVFQHHYGDCKDKATLMITMLKEVGIESYYVIINTERGSVLADTPAHVDAFDHAIIAIKIPDDLNDSSLVATLRDPKLGRILFFDPTNSFVPFGQIGGYLQENYGLLVTPEGGELVALPKLPDAATGISRRGVLRLDASGNFTGEFTEMHLGDAAWGQREYLKSVAKSSDRIKIIEAVLSESLPNFAVTKASIQNLELTDQPFGFVYSVQAQRYAKPAGDLLLVRPRVIGVDSRALLETKEPRQFPVIFEGPERNTDLFEITLPAGYEVDDLPPPVDVDYSFASYHSKTEAAGNVLKYTRTFEIKELSVPMSKMDDLKKFYRIIAGDERNTAVLKPAAQ